MRRQTVISAGAKYTDDNIFSEYKYNSTCIKELKVGSLTVTPVERVILFKTAMRPRKTGLMLVGWGGNNGTTVTAGILANQRKMAWMTKKGKCEANYYGSITQASTVRLGVTEQHKEVFAPLSSIVPLLDPNNIVVDGWDCSGLNLAEAMRRARVFDYNLQEKLYPLLKDMHPRSAIFDLNFVSANQDFRANNVIKGTKWEAIMKVREDIQQFKNVNTLEKVIVLWTANTERWCSVTEGIHDTADNILLALKSGADEEISPSTCYAIAAALEGCNFLNGAPQNTLVPGAIELAERNGVFVGGDDLKSGQTKMKSALVEFMVSAGIKPECIASYNHLGNNDGLNLSSPMQFRSKEITKSNVIDDMVASNAILYPEGASQKPDHCVVIKYLPYVADSKRALDEYNFSIFMGGEQCISIHNVCEDSLLAAPLIIDLCILTELMERVKFKDLSKGREDERYQKMDTVLSILSYLFKAPLVPAGMPVVNALNRQKYAIENLLKALVGIPPDNNMMLECRGF